MNLTDITRSVAPKARRRSYTRALIKAVESPATTMNSDTVAQLLQNTLEIGPLVLMPCQMEERNYIPEQELIEGLIRQACHDAIFGGRGVTYHGDKPHLLELKKRRIVIEALGWVFSDLDEPWSFSWCCEAVKLDARRILGHLLKHVPEAERVRLAMKLDEVPDAEFAASEHPQSDLRPLAGQTKTPSARDSYSSGRYSTSSQS